MRIAPMPSRLALTVKTRSRPSRERAVSGTLGVKGSTAITEAEGITLGQRCVTVTTMPAPTTSAAAAPAATGPQRRAGRTGGAESPPIRCQPTTWLMRRHANANAVSNVTARS